MFKEGVLYFLATSTLLGIGCGEKRPEIIQSEQSPFSFSSDNRQMNLVFEKQFLGRVTHFQQAFRTDTNCVSINLARNMRLSVFEITLENPLNKQPQSGVHFETGSYNPNGSHILEINLNNRSIIESIYWDSEKKQFSRLKF